MREQYFLITGGFLEAVLNLDANYQLLVSNILNVKKNTFASVFDNL